MKYFLLILLFPVTLFAQDCKLKKEVNDFTHETKLSTGFMPFSRISVAFDADSKEITFFFLLNEGSERCFDDASTAMIVFDGSKTKTTYRNSGTMNCDGIMRSSFRNSSTTPSLLQKLANQKVGTITLTGSNNNITVVTLSEDQKQKLMEAASCIIKEGKTLLKQP